MWWTYVESSQTPNGSESLITRLRQESAKLGRAKSFGQSKTRSIFTGYRQIALTIARWSRALTVPRF